MARRKTLTQTQLAKLPRRATRYYLADPVQQGLILRIPPQGPSRLAGRETVVASLGIHRHRFLG